MFRILLVDDDMDMRQAMRTTLSQAGYAITEAEHGRIAQNFLKTEKFDLVISDFQMPQMNGVELLTWIKGNVNIPVILITGFSHILETQSAFDMGAAGFLTKPFSYREVLQTIQKVLAPTDANQSLEDTEASFCQIPIDDFVSGSGMQISIYIKLSEKKFIRISHQGDEVATDKVETYKSKGVNYLYAKREDFSRLVGFNLNLSKLVQNDPNVSAEKKARFLQYTTALIMENTAIKGVQKNAFEHANNSLNTYMSLVANSSDLFQVLQALDSNDDWLYAHSLGVSMYSLMIGKRLGWKGQSTLFKLSTAALFHDIGEKELPKEITQKPKESLTLEERKIFETHSERGRNILVELNEVPADILQIVYEHHEDCLGRGYPKQTKKEKIHPLAKVIAVADRFCNYAIKSPRSQGCDAAKAIELMEKHDAHQLDVYCFAALKAVCDPSSEVLK